MDERKGAEAVSSDFEGKGRGIEAVRSSIGVLVFSTSFSRYV